MVYLQRIGLLPCKPCIGSIRCWIVSLFSSRILTSSRADKTLRPFFDRVTIALPWAEGYLNKTSPNFDENLGGYRLTVTSYGAPNKPYVKSLHVNGVERQEPIIRHEEIRYGADIVFEMSDSPQPWGNVQK